MLDKFLSRVNNSSYDNKSVTQKVEDYNKKVIEEKKVIPPAPNVDWDKVILPERYVDNKFSGFQNISKSLSPRFNNTPKNSVKPFQRPSTYDVRPQKNYDNDFQQHNQRERPQQFQRREYIDDGSYFCSYAVGGNTLVCYKNKEKVEFLLEGISHPDKNNYLAKRANYFLNDLVKKQKVYIEPTEHGTYNIFLDPAKTNCVNTILINEGYHNSEPYNAQTKDKKTSFSKYKNNQENEKDNKTDIKNEEHNEEIKEKKNYAYGLFATNHNTFEALFNKEKITLKIPNIDNISKEHQKICKSMIYDFISKKSIILKFLNEEDNIRYVEVYNKEGECLNQLINDKKFPNVIEESSESKQEEDEQQNTLNKEDEQCSENDWNWVDSDNNGAEVNVPEVTNLPAMFKNAVASKPDSPFKKKFSAPVKDNSTHEKNNTQEESFGEEVNVPEVTNLPAMFKNPVVSKPDSPFKKKFSAPVKDNSVDEQTNTEKEIFVEDINVPDITNLPAMFKQTTSSNSESPFKKKTLNVNIENTPSISTKIDNSQEENKVIEKKKLSFMKR